MIKLFIDSTKKDVLDIAIDKDGKRFQLSDDTRVKRGSQVILLAIDKLLKKAKLTTRDIDEIHVATGPGSYTGIRVGVSVANALSYALSVPVNQKSLGTFVDGVYQ